MNVGTLNDFLDIKGQTYEKVPKRARSQSNPTPVEKSKKVEQIVKTDLNKSDILKNNIQRFKIQLQAVYNHRKKHSTPKSMIVEKPQSVKRPQLIAMPIQSPNYLGLFDKSRVFADFLKTNTLKQRHHLLRTVHDVKQEQNKDKMSSLIDQAYLRMQDELNNQSQIRSLERQQYIQQYEIYNKHIPTQVKEKTHSDSEDSSQEEKQQKIRTLKTKKQNTVVQKSNKKNLILQFPQYRWCKLRNMSFQVKESSVPDSLELSSSKFMEQIMETSKNKKTDIIDKLEQIVNQIFE